MLSPTARAYGLLLAAVALLAATVADPHGLVSTHFFFGLVVALAWWIYAARRTRQDPSFLAERPRWAAWLHNQHAPRMARVRGEDPGQVEDVPQDQGEDEDKRDDDA